MLAQLGGGLYPAATAGVKRTTLSQLLDPELLTAIGVISPDYLSQALQSYVDTETATVLSQALKDYDSKVQKIEAKYTPPVFVSAADQNLRSLAASYPDLADAIAGIQQGTLDADAYAATLTDEVVRSNVKAFGRDWSRYQQDLLEFQTIDVPQYNQEIRALGDPPTAESLGITRESLKTQFAEDMGVPGLALLPDPGETYKIDPEEMRQFRKPTQAGTDRRLFESMLMSGAGRDIPRYATPRLTGAPAPKPKVLEGDPMGRTVDTPGFGRGSEGVAPSQRPRPAGYVAPSLERDLARYAQQDYESLMVDAMLREQQMAAKGRTPFEDALRQAQIFAQRTR
jgi:hypothetical protein